MTALRYLAAVVVVLLAAVLLQHCLIIPWQMNAAKRIVYKGTRQAVSTPAAAAAALARENVDRLSPYLGRPDFDAESLVLMAANTSLLGRPEEAIRYYIRAAEKEGRPEIYRYLASMEIEHGRHQAAVEHYATAVEFAPDSIALVPEWVREEVAARTRLRQARR